MWQGSGWHRDLPDHRDFTLRHEIVSAATARLAALDGQRPDKVDWRDYFPPVERQRPLAASSVEACVGMVLYFERRAHGRQLEPSRLFVYKNARRLLRWTGDCGATLRSTLKAIRRFGLPPQSLWPDCLENLDREPDAFAYSYEEETRRMTYVRIDARNVPGAVVLESACSLLAGGFCFVLGFPLNGVVGGSAMLSYPTLLDSSHGGQAVVAVGYDDRLRIRSDKGALLVRNSWGADWGEAGYGWLPYAYVRDGLAADLWTVVQPAWLESGEFRRPEMAASLTADE
ncbi:MAG TPA: C1 family peptidase [Pirellulales bacterium]|nr:C1 family peptidase [Pirellulales bacterium]